MLNKAQLDALVIDGDGHDEDVIALLAHARESLAVIARLQGALEEYCHPSGPNGEMWCDLCKTWEGHADSCILNKGDQ